MERSLQFALTSVAVIWFLFKKGNNNMTVKEDNIEATNKEQGHRMSESEF